MAFLGFGKKGKKKGSGRRQINPKRRIEIIYMVLAVALILGAVPLVSSLIYRYNQITPPGDMVRLLEEDYESIIAYHEYGQVELGNQTNIVWVTNETDDDNILVLEPNWKSEQEWYEGINSVLIITKIRIDDIIDNGWTEWIIEISDGEYTFAVEIQPTFPNGTIDYGGPMTTYDYGEVVAMVDKEGNISETVTMPAIDAMLWSVESDNGLLCVMLSNTSFWQEGDMIGFDIYYSEPSTDLPTEPAIWRYGAIIMGAVLILVALGSTPWWNPLKPKEKGAVDRGIDQAGGWIRKRRGKK